MDFGNNSKLRQFIAYRGQNEDAIDRNYLAKQVSVMGTEVNAFGSEESTGRGPPSGRNEQWDLLIPAVNSEE